jgi:hypothetical protein
MFWQRATSADVQLFMLSGADGDLKFLLPPVT